MNQLKSQDWRTLAAALEDLHADVDPRTLTARTLAATATAIAADSAAFTGFYRSGGYADLMWTNGGEYSLAQMEIFAAFIHENPLFGAFIVEQRTEALKITDLMSPRDFERTAIYNEFYKRVGVSNQLVKPLEISDGFLITCSLNIENRDFFERDKQMLTMLAPHLAHAIRNAFAFERLNCALETKNCAVVALGASGELRFVNDYARRIFDCYFADEKGGGDALPPIIAAWLAEIEAQSDSNEFRLPPAPLKIENARGVLTIRLMQNRTTKEKSVLLEEQRFLNFEFFRKIGLTKREAEILSWIARGKSDDGIAALCGIALRTVHKHVEHIYTKLGVETRTAAMLKVFESRRRDSI